MDRFNIQKFIDKACQMDLYPLSDFLNTEMKALELIKLPNKTSQERDQTGQKLEYRQFISGVAFILMNGMKPHMRRFEETKPIIEALVSRGDLHERALDIYK